MIINIPPRHSKSLTTCVFWPAWEWLRSPGTRFLHSSYAQTLSTRDSVKCRHVLQSARYQELKRYVDADWELTGDQNTKTRFANTEGGERLATSVEGVGTGEGGDKIVIDDPHNLVEVESKTERQNVIDWWDNSMSTRLSSKEGAIVIIMQRSHHQDLVGHLLELMGESEDNDQWETLILPARYEGENRSRTSLGLKDVRTEPNEPLWPERFDDVELKRVEGYLGSYGSAGQLQQRPSPRKGGLIQSGWFEVVDDAPVMVEKRVRFWDLAATKDEAKKDPDWTAGARVSLRRGVFYVEDIAALRDTPLRVEEKVTQCAETDPAAHPNAAGSATEIAMEEEPGASGKTVTNHYAREVLTGLDFHAVRSTGAKEEYVKPLAAQAEAGNVKVVRGPWNRAFFEECDGFPNAAHDDRLDSVAKAFARIGGRPDRARIWGSGA